MAVQCFNKSFILALSHSQHPKKTPLWYECHWIVGFVLHLDAMQLLTKSGVAQWYFEPIDSPPAFLAPFNPTMPTKILQLATEQAS